MECRRAFVVSALVLFSHIAPAPAPAQQPAAPSSQLSDSAILELEQEFLSAAGQDGLLSKKVAQLAGAGQSEIVEGALLAAYAAHKDVPVGYPERQEIVNALALFYSSSNRMIELELLRKGERHDKFNAEYALMHLPDMGRDFPGVFEWTQSRSPEAAVALAEMAVRRFATMPGDRELIRERQDLFNEWRTLVAASGDGSGKDRKREIAARVEEIDSRLVTLLPHVATAVKAGKTVGEALENNTTLSLERTQQLLSPSEALIAFVHFHRNDTTRGEYLFLWVVTKTEHKYVRVSLGETSIADRVTALRCGLDETSWYGEGKKLCSRLLDINTENPRPKPLPFSSSLAHELYKILFGDVENLLIASDGTGKQLLLVPSGPLTALPFQVLVTKSPEPATAMASVDWLAKRHALVVLPSVSSLESLRANAKRSTAPEPFIAFGDPLLSRSCVAPPIPKVCPGEGIETASAEYAVTRSSGDLETAASFMRGGLADVAALKERLCPLPDTAFEVTCVAKSLDAAPQSIVLGRDMTEAKVKSMDLSRYRIVHFATHGLLAGETAQLAKDRAEPALVLSPPDIPTERDDGLLTASEVVGLKLDADWVVMSACNTAAGGGEPDAEALSGLAKAFFYAGARALLVSHWPVNSTAATMLTSRTFAELKIEPSIGRAEAFRRSMLALMTDKDRRWAAHPSMWAPFVLVGEGGTGR